MDGMKEKRCTCGENQLRNRVLELEAHITELERERDALQERVDLRLRIGAELAEKEAERSALATRCHNQREEIVRLEAERDALLTRLGNTEASRDAIRGRINRLSRLDIDDPASYCLHALNEGEISLAKACEWLRKYLLTGAQDPIKQGIMRSGGADESLREVREQRDALAAALEIANRFLLVAESYRLGSTAWNSLPVDRELEMCRLRDELQSAIRNPSAILAARLAEERKAGALNELNLWADEGDLDEAVVTRMRRRAAQIERGEEKP
jgi:hypothetical protein